jgi:hypothetical protein
MTGSYSTEIAPPRVLPVGATPANLPVTVRVNLLSYLFSVRRVELVTILLFGLPMLAFGVVALVLSDPTLTSDDRRAGWFVGAAGLAFLAYLPISGRRQIRDGFSVGADHTGVYLRPNLDRKRVVYIPWSGVEGVRVRRWRGPQLVVKPRDTVIEGAFDLEIKGRWEDRMNAEISQHRRMKKLGTNIHAPIPGADRTELLNNLRYQAAGRAPVEMQ